MSSLPSVEPETFAALNGSDVLVTGGAGFVGSRLAAALTEVCDVTVLDDFSVGTAEAVPAAATVISGDVRDVETVHSAVEPTDVVFHMAGQTDGDLSTRKPAETHHRNASGTVCVLEAARANDSRVVLASDAAVYGSPDSVPVHETDATEPTSPHGISKLAADQYARAYADLYGLPTVALRYFNVYGPGRRANPGVVETFVERARAGDPLEIHGAGDQTRDFVHLEDAVAATMAAAATEDVGRAFNVGTGTGTSVRELAALVREVSEADPELVHRDPRPRAVEHSVADVSRARESLGYEPTVSLRDGVETMLERHSTLRH